MIFRSTYFRLTFFYVLVIMCLSIFFSISLYQISTSELNRGLGKQSAYLKDLPPANYNIPNFAQEMDRARAEQQKESSDRLRTNLIYFNILILAASSVASYFFAKKSLKPIEDSIEVQNRFTADASHELRTPLTAMRTEIEVAMRDKNFNFTESKKLLASNLEEINRLETLSNALLKLAKSENEIIDTGKISLEEVITEAYSKVESLAKQKSIVFDTSLKNINVNGDKSSLVELFLILFDNAIKYSPKNSKIKVTMEIEKNKILVTVKDNGNGIKACDLLHIFDRFYRADLSRSKEKVIGYGLGLAIAKQISELHKGTIRAKSKVGKGSDFIVSLPYLK